MALQAPFHSFALDISVPLFAPQDARAISPSHVSFSIEQDRWTDWSGTTEPNDYWINTLDNLVQLAGAPPDIRIGANSEDHTNYDPNVEFSTAIFPDPSATVPYPEARSIIVGDGYYTTARFLPPNTHVTWGVPLGSNNVTAAVLQADAIKRAFDSSEMKERNIVLDYVEIGNEADLYRNNGQRPSDWGVDDYVREWIQFGDEVADAADLTINGHTKFLVGGFAGSSHNLNGFSPQAIYNLGILDSDPGKFIGAFSEHRYSGSFCSGNGGLLSDLMTKSTIRGNLSIYTPDIAATRQVGIDYVMGETNSYSCHGAPGVSNTAGAAIWALDYALYAAQLDMSRVFFHIGIGFKYNLVQPITLNRSILDASSLPEPLPPHIHMQYYAAIIVAEAISGEGTKTVELDVGDERVSGYGFYEGDTIKRAVLIRSKAWLRESQGERGSSNIVIAFDGQGEAPQKMKVKRLKIGFADDTTGVTWGGQTYETQDGRVEGELEEKTVNVVDGVKIEDTEAVLLTFL